MNDDIAINVEHVSKSFKLPHEKSGSVKGALLGWRKRKRGYEMQHVLKDVSFEIKKGEFFGVVGRNGSGKSTLLKLISQIYTPDKGSIVVNGKLTPFIELGVGFNPELSGRDNVYLNGALLGFNREEMDAMYDEIVEFAELDRFMDQKLKNYSSGMQVRLAFSIAIRANTDILVLDEVLAVGDEAFQKKCNDYFAETRKNKEKTVILVTHSMDSVRKYCNRAMLILDGKVVSVGNPDEVAEQYSVINRKTNRNVQTIKKDYSADIKIKPIANDEKIKFDIEIFAKKNIKDAIFALSLSHERLGFIFWANYRNGKQKLNFKKGEYKKITLEIDNIFPADDYSLDANLRNDDASLRFGHVDAQFFHNKRKKKYDRSYSFLPSMHWSDHE